MAFNKEKFTEKAREHMKYAREFWHTWRVGAVDDYAFISGNQWHAEDEAVLRDERRPPITFNYSEKMVDAVVGAEVSNRQEATYKPRGIEDSALAELMNNAAKWVRDECAAEDEESDAFRDMLICGMGWTQTRLSYEEDQDGKIYIERMDPLEFYVDPAANKPGLTDRSYAFREWWTNEEEAKREWPGKIFTALDSDNTNRGTVTRNHRYEDGTEESDFDRHRGQVQIICYECVETQPIYRVVLGDKIQEMSVKDFNGMKDELDSAQAEYIKQRKRVYYRAFFTGETLLEVAESPSQDGFTYQCITGKRDRNKNTWYGLTRVMKDPQRWANKWLSQILHIINSNAKGGLMAEVNAFVDPKKAQEEWAKPDSITLFKEGALSGKKVQPKEHGQFPAGLDKLMQFALGSLPMVTGINLEALGLANREQAGVLEAQRKQAAYGLLAPLFDSLRRYRKTQGRVLLHMIDKYISDGRMIRIGGPGTEQYMPLRKIPDGMHYDIIVDQSPNAPDVKDKTWEALMQLVPAMLKAGMPLPPDLLDYAPLPTALVAKWKQFAATAQKPDPQMQKMQEEMAKLQEENAELKQDMQIEMQELQMKRAQIQEEMKLKREIAESEMQLEMLKMQNELKIAQAKASIDMQIAQQKSAVDMELAKRKGDTDTKLAEKKASTANEVAKINARNKPNGASNG